METKNKGYNLNVVINNFKLYYDDVGEGDIPIILLHGFPFDKTMWQPQVDFLKSSYRIIACDIRGFGKSIEEESPLSIELFADDLIQFMDELKLETAIICGLSMGGYIALNAIKRFPERFEAMILCDTQCIADSDETKEKRNNTIAEIDTNGVAKFNEGFIKNIFHKDSLAYKRDLVMQLRYIVFSNSKHIIMQGLAALAARSETCSSLKKVKVPTLILCGRRDLITPPAQSEMMHASIKGSVLQIIDNAGHVSNLEQPNEFNKYLLEFLIGIEAINFNKINGIQRMA